MDLSRTFLLLLIFLLVAPVLNSFTNNQATSSIDLIKKGLQYLLKLMLNWYASWLSLGTVWITSQNRYKCEKELKIHNKMCFKFISFSFAYCLKCFLWEIYLGHLWLRPTKFITIYVWDNIKPWTVTGILLHVCLPVLLVTDVYYCSSFLLIQLWKDQLFLQKCVTT